MILEKGKMGFVSYVLCMIIIAMVPLIICNFPFWLLNSQYEFRFHFMAVLIT